MRGTPSNKPLKLSAAGFSRQAAVLDTSRGSIARGRSLAAIRWAASEMRTVIPLLSIAIAGIACDQPESAACAKLALERIAEVRELREASPGSLDFDLWLAPEVPTTRFAAALKLGRDSAVLAAASCELPGSESRVLEIRNALASTCGIEISVERTSSSCEHLPLRSTGLGYILDAK